MQARSKAYLTSFLICLLGGSWQAWADTPEPNSRDYAAPVDTASVLEFGYSTHPAQYSGGADGKWEDSIVSVLDLKDARAYVSRASVRARVGDLKGSRSDFDRALRLDPKNADAFCGRGYLNLYAGDNAGALLDFDRAIALNHRICSAFCGRGQAHSELGHKEEALADFNKAVELDPANAQAYIFRGYHLVRQGEKSRAIADFDQTIKLDPNNALAYCYRGRARESVQDQKGAIADFKKVIEFDPQYAWAYYRRGQARDALGQRKEAIDDFNQYIQLLPRDPWGYRARGFSRHELKNKAGAIADYTKALMLDSKDAWTYKARGFTRHELGNKRGAIADYTKAMALDPTDPWLYSARGFERWRSGDTMGAIADYKKANAIEYRHASRKNPGKEQSSSSQKKSEIGHNATSQNADPGDQNVELIEDREVYEFAARTLHTAVNTFGQPVVPIRQLYIFHRPGPRCQTVMTDADKGTFCIFIANDTNDEYFHGNLAHELLHLLNSKLFDPYVEGLCSLFGEQCIDDRYPEGSKWRRAFVKLVNDTPFYCETYQMMKELEGAIGSSKLQSILTFAVADQTFGWMHLDIDQWIATLNDEERARVGSIIAKYADDIDRTMPKNGAYVFERPKEFNPAR